MLKNKTLAAWLTFLGGPLGWHRFYLHGVRDPLAWLLPWPTLLGIYGIQRARLYGVDDLWSWVLIPLFGFTFAACALNAIVYGLMSRQQWNQRYNAQAQPEDAAGGTGWLTIGAVASALLIGTSILVSTLAFSFQRYFEFQVEEARKISQ